MTGVLVRRAEVDGAVVDVRTDGRVVVEVGERLVRRGEQVVDAGGAALLPGLHDHHLHLLALAAALTSVELSGARTREELGGRLREAATRAPDHAWLRATGYHESGGSDDLDRWGLDALVADRPVRVQHRGGALWVFNSAALAHVEGALDDSSDIERDASGVPTGRFFRLDDRLRAHVPTTPLDLAAVGARLRELGITRVTDATPDLDDSAIVLLQEAVARHELPQHVVLLGAPDDGRVSGLTVGPAKILLADHRPPDFGALCDSIADHHRRRRAVAVHCVTREALVLTVAALDEVGPWPGDRIEHAAVVGPDILPRLQQLGVAIVTQPDFLRSRGDDYLREVDPDDVPGLYPYAGLLRAGIPVCPSSDAPFGALDPWRVMASARDRRTSGGRQISPAEAVSAATALSGYLRSVPGGPRRRVVTGAPADLVLLDEPWEMVADDLSARHVRTVIGLDT